jgi:hypothetical protein
MTANDIAKALGVSDRYVRKYKGAFRYHQSYYWGFFNGPDRLIAKIKKIFPSATILDSGNHWHSFDGGAKSGTAKDSFLWVQFRL